jgi:hypothetical protein
MHISNIVVSVALLAFSALPSFAADSMMAGASMSMMKAGEVVAIMRDGHMGTMMMTDPDAKMEANMMKMSKPIDGCIMLLTGKELWSMALPSVSTARKQFGRKYLS